MGKLDGHCLCGAVTYSSDVDPVFTGICHCNDCQRQSGSAFSIVVGVPADQIEVKGDMASYTTVGEDHGSEVHRRFCSTCGSPVLSEPQQMPGLVVLKAGTLNDTSWLAPQVEVWGRSAQPWVETHETRPRLERGPAA